MSVLAILRFPVLQERLAAVKVSVYDLQLKSVAVLLVLNIDFSASSSQPSQVNNGIQEVDKAFAQLSSAYQAYLLSVYQEDVFLNN